METVSPRSLEPRAHTKQEFKCDYLNYCAQKLPETSIILFSKMSFVVKNKCEILQYVCTLLNLPKSATSTFPYKTRIWEITSASFLSRGRSIHKLRIPDRISPSSAIDDAMGLHKTGIIYKLRISFLWRMITPRMRGAPRTRDTAVCPSICVLSRTGRRFTDVSVRDAHCRPDSPCRRYAHTVQYVLYVWCIVKCVRTEGYQIYR